MKFQRHRFTVTRQRQWPEGTLCVEISQGGPDYTNPGQLVAKFGKLGEDETFDGMTPAVQAGIAVWRAWKEITEDPIGIAVGNTGGNTMPFDGEDLTEEYEKELLEKAREFDEGLEKCAHCGDILTDDRFGAYGENDCCSQHCAEMHYCSDEEELEELEAD
jgi:hypothetical protein